MAIYTLCRGASTYTFSVGDNEVRVRLLNSKPAREQLLSVEDARSRWSDLVELGYSRLT